MVRLQKPGDLFGDLLLERDSHLIPSYYLTYLFNDLIFHYLL
jgi:hypothetical protein